MSKELAASGQLSAEDIERIRSVLTGNRIQAYKAGEQGVADVMTRIIDFQFNTLCDMALRSLTAPTNTPNGDRQELIDKCLDAGRDEGIEAAAKILHEPWASAVRALAQGQRSEAAATTAESREISKQSLLAPERQSSDRPTEADELLRDIKSWFVNPIGANPPLDYFHSASEILRRIDAHLSRKEQ